MVNKYEEYERVTSSEPAILKRVTSIGEFAIEVH